MVTKRAVYSALIGDYEKLTVQSVPPTDGVDFIFFTNTDSKASAGWKTVKIDPRYPLDLVRSARYIKTVGHDILDNYDETLWIDNRVRLKVGFERIFENLKYADISMSLNSYRRTVADEFSAVVEMGFDDPDRVRLSNAMAISESVMNSPTFWTGMLLKSKSDSTAACMRYWMDQILLGSRRDQLSINIAIAHSGATVKTLDIRNEESQFHDWLSIEQTGRDKVSQEWRPPKLPARLRLADMGRRLPGGYRLGRGLKKIGIRLPTILSSPSRDGEDRK